MIRRVLLLSCTLAICHLGKAQSGGSPYSSFGIGDYIHQTWGQGQGLAGAGIGLRSDLFMNVRNPATYSALRDPLTTVFSIGLHFSYEQFSTANTIINQRDGNLSHAALWLKPAPAYGMGIGLEPVSDVQYSIINQRDWAAVSDSYNVINEGEGGLSRFYWGHSLSLGKNWSFGLQANAYFGSIVQSEQARAVRQEDTFLAETTTQLNGLGFEWGLQWQKQLGADWLTIGAVFNGGNSLNANREVVLSSLTDTLFEEGEAISENYLIPLSYGFGASWKRPNFLLTTEVLYEGWGSLSREGDAAWEDVWAFTLGSEFRLTANSFKEYYQAVVLRTGLSVRNSQLRINGSTFNQYTASIGLGIPYRSGLNHLNINYSYNQRGKRENGLVLERQHQIGVSFSLRDRWFVKRKLF
ncbi:MAG: hypothetical protein AAF433_06115 [Bacteroidota bacterium]